jgi:hypothetical protein
MNLRDRVSRLATETAAAGLRLTQFFGGLVAAAGGLLLGYQCLTWLRFGEWIPYSLLDIWLWAGWGWPSVEWVGAQKIIDWLLGDFLALPTTIIALVGGGALTLWASITAHQLESRRPLNQTVIR